MLAAGRSDTHARPWTGLDWDWRSIWSNPVPEFPFKDFTPRPVSSSPSYLREVIAAQAAAGVQLFSPQRQTPAAGLFVFVFAAVWCCVVFCKVHRLQLLAQQLPKSPKNSRAWLLPMTHTGTRTPRPRPAAAIYGQAPPLPRRRL